MTDFQTAMSLAGGIILLATLVLIFQPRRPPSSRPATTSSAVPADLAAIEDKIRAFDGRMSDVEHDLKQVRTMLNALPTKDSVHQLALSVSEVKGDLKLNNAQTETTAKTVEKIMTWLMDEAKTKAAAK